jgi:type I restriction enzyme S subunit
MELKPGYKQTEVGVIPEDWEVRRLSDLAKIRSGIAKNSNASLSNPVTVPYLRVANVQDGFLDLGEVSSISIGRDDLERYLLRPGDVLMNEGGDLDKLGRGAIWRGELKQCIHQNHVFAIRCTATLLPEFLNAWASGKAARRYFVVAGKQTTNLASINKTAIGGLPIALPSPREQQQIAEALDSLSAHEASVEDLIAKKKQIKQAAMQELLTGKRRLPGFEGEWEVKRLGNVLSICHGKNQREVEVADGPYPILATGGQIGTAARPLHGKPSVLIGRKGTINKPQYMDTPFWTVDTLFYSAMKEENCARFFYYLFCTIDWMQFNEASGLPSLNARTIESIEVDCPTTQEQYAIASALSEIDAELAALEARKVKVQMIKQGMMQQLLTGKIRLK